MNPEHRWAPISPLERRLEHLADYTPRRTFRFARSMHAEPDLAARSADILAPGHDGDRRSTRRES